MALINNLGKGSGNAGNNNVNINGYGLHRAVDTGITKDTIRQNAEKLRAEYKASQEPRGGSGGGGGGNANAVLGATSLGDDIIAKIKGLLEEQTKASDASAKAWYDQYMSQLRGDTTANLERSNRQYKFDMKRDGEIHGRVPDSGTGFTNRARITQNWRDRNNTIRMNDANNSATALANYQSQLANNASTLAQGWYNQVLPYYVNQANRT